MTKVNLRKIAILLLFATIFALCTLVFAACDEQQLVKMDVALFMGQSNMAGRGDSSESIVCQEGHAYEFRAVDDPTKLYPVVEPFGATENNEALSDLNSITGDGKKSGGMTSAFCEGYYEKTQTPLVAISASVGGTSVLKWIPGTSYFAECVRRLNACLDYLEQNNVEVGNVFMVWCQGESDKSNWKAGNFDYFGYVKQIVDGLQDVGGGRGISKCFIVTPSEYAKGALDATKNDLVNNIIQNVLADDDFVLASVKFRNVPDHMRDDPHFRQGIYNVTGYDAGQNTAEYFLTGVQPDCKEFILGEDVSLAEKFGLTPTYTSI